MLNSAYTASKEYLNNGQLLLDTWNQHQLRYRFWTFIQISKFS